jgi:hypothetical protein
MRVSRGRLGGAGTWPTSAGPQAIALIIVSIPAARAAVEPVFDRTSVRVVAHVFEAIKTRVEHMFEIFVRAPYAVVMAGSLHGTTDTTADLH